jgi:hypothetical protein
MKLPSPRHVVESAGFYPITTLYLVGVLIAFLVVGASISPLLGILAFSVAVVIAILVAAYKEIRTVHRLVARIEKVAVIAEPEKGWEQ